MSTEVLEALKKTYDYVVIGGGTAGLVIASRLSSDPSVSVIVLEAGEAHDLGDPNIAIPGQFGSHFGKPKYDWGFSTVPQQHASGQKVSWSRGKGLGGSSAINFQCWITPPSQDVDAIEELGNPGWNWNGFKKYERRASNQLKTAVPYRSVAFDNLFSDTLTEMGLEKNEDPYNGNNTGPFVASGNIDPETWTRSYSANAYYSAVKHLPNITVIAEAAAARVLFNGSTPGDLTATGVEFIYNGKTYVAQSRKEVIVSAGAIKSPHILELSGIGKRDVLEKIGVDVKIELPGVGENVQEHITVVTTFEINSDVSYETVDLMRNPEYAADRLKLHAEGKGMPAVNVTSFAYIPLSFASPEAAPKMIQDVENKVEELKNSGKLPPGLAEQYDIQLRNLRNPAIPDCQLVLFPGYFASQAPHESNKTYFSLFPIANHTFSRGSIHARSADPLEYPVIDPHYLDMEYDLELLVQHIAFTRRIVAHEPLKSVIKQELDPGSENDTDSQLRDYIKKTLNTTYHTIGSCSMMPRDKNGVVSPELIVYGTKNLRVADLSIIPIHIAAHTQSTAYVIGEKAADLIRGLYSVPASL